MQNVSRTAIVTLLACACGPALRADSVIAIDLSFKVVRNPANGARPPCATNAAVEESLREMNDLLGRYWRGYRVERIGAVQEIGGTGTATDPSQWYDVDFLDPNVNGNRLKDQMEGMAMADPAYAWDPGAINIYVTAGPAGGICSFPGDNDEIIVVGGCALGLGSLVLHEVGHYFNLCHTQGCSCGCCDTTQTGECHTSPGDDESADTLPDLACWTRDDIANSRFGTTYASLSSGEQSLVDDVFLNLMSYHGSACGQGSAVERLTEMQLDRWTEAADSERTQVRDGRTIFVDLNFHPLVQNGTKRFPYGSLEDAVNAASQIGGDIVLLAPGAYDERPRLTKPVTFRATRAGPASVGSAAPPQSRRPRPEPERSSSPAADEPAPAAKEAPWLGVPGAPKTSRCRGPALHHPEKPTRALTCP